MDKFNPVDMSLWQGRQDPEDGELALRWHDKVLPWTAGAQDTAGVVLLGFSCDEGVRRNKGRVGAAGAPQAVRKLLANTAWHLNRPVYDGGDVSCTDGDLDAAHGRLAERVSAALDLGHFPLVLGAATRWPSAAGAASTCIWRVRGESGSSISTPTSTCA